MRKLWSFVFIVSFVIGSFMMFNTCFDALNQANDIKVLLSVFTMVVWAFVSFLTNFRYYILKQLKILMGLDKVLPS